MKILVTGANGYLGQGIVKHILGCGNEVIATDFSKVVVTIPIRHKTNSIFMSRYCDV